MEIKKTKFNNIIRVPCTLNDIFKLWLEFLIPFHHLTAREMEVAVGLLKERYRLSKIVSDPDILDKVLMDEEVLKRVREECHLTNQHLQILKGKLRAKKFLIKNKINPRLIPNIIEDKGTFQLLLLLEIL